MIKKIRVISLIIIKIKTKYLIRNNYIYYIIKRIFWYLNKNSKFIITC